MPSPVYIKDGFFVHGNGKAYYLESIARKVIKEMKGEKVEYDDIEKFLCRKSIHNKRI